MSIQTETTAPNVKPFATDLEYLTVEFAWVQARTKRIEADQLAMNQAPELTKMASGRVRAAHGDATVGMAGQPAREEQDIRQEIDERLAQNRAGDPGLGLDRLRLELDPKGVLDALLCLLPDAPLRKARLVALMYEVSTPASALDVGFEMTGKTLAVITGIPAFEGFADPDLLPDVDWVAGARSGFLETMRCGKNLAAGCGTVGTESVTGHPMTLRSLNNFDPGQPPGRVFESRGRIRFANSQITKGGSI